MKRKILFASLLLGLTATAQDYEWQWAKRGGGIKRISNESPLAEDYNSEQVIDIAVDADNNYYYLAYIGQGQTEFDGEPITVYNTSTESFSASDMLLISTDCEGTLRWTQTIGGGNYDEAYNIQLDDNGGLYMAAVVSNSQTLTPPHFSPDDAMGELTDITQPSENFKTMALLKYNTNDGSLAWRVMPQGVPSTMALGFGNISQIQVDSQGVIHVLVGFKAGTHLDGMVTVPDIFTGNFNLKYYIVKYTADGGLISSLPLSFEGGMVKHNTRFRYDEGLGRYYITGLRNYGGSTEYIDLSFNGEPITGQAYILAISTTGAEIWRNESSAVSQFNDFKINDLEIDTDHSLYLCGRYFNDHNTGGVGFGDYDMPNELTANIMYAMKLNTSGTVQWLRQPTGYNVPGGDFTGMHNAYSIDVKGDNVVVATQISNEIFEDISFNRPPNCRSDAALLHLNKATGGVIAVNDVIGAFGYNDVFTAVLRDNDGNYITGGAFHYDFFTAEDDNIATIQKIGQVEDYSDFFIAKFANAVCGSGGGTVGVEDFKADVLAVYPNPANGIVNIQTREQLSSYEVVNMLGQVLLKGSFVQGQNQIVIESLSAGTYIINVKTAGNTTISRKIIKE